MTLPHLAVRNINRDDEETTWRSGTCRYRSARRQCNLIPRLTPSLRDQINRYGITLHTDLDEPGFFGGSRMTYPAGSDNRALPRQRRASRIYALLSGNEC